MTVHALDDPKLVLDEKDVAMGKAQAMRCGSCHGAGFIGAGAPGPDLRESAIALDLDSFRQTVREGRMAQGMPAFPQLTDTEIRQIHAYLRARAREALGRRPPTTPVPPAAAETPKQPPQVPVTR
jgi:quinohemoprotein ethanol dehydrogenase